jgi:hypothetical protein
VDSFVVVPRQGGRIFRLMGPNPKAVGKILAVALAMEFRNREPGKVVADAIPFGHELDEDVLVRFQTGVRVEHPGRNLDPVPLGLGRRHGASAGSAEIRGIRGRAVEERGLVGTDGVRPRDRPIVGCPDPDHRERRRSTQFAAPIAVAELEGARDRIDLETNFATQTTAEDGHHAPINGGQDPNVAY